MSQPEPKTNEPGKMNESPMERLKRSAGAPASQLKENAQMVVRSDAAEIVPESHNMEPAVKPEEIKKSDKREFKFLPAFWTIASVMSFTVNIVLLVVLAILLQNFRTVGVTLTALPDHLLGGLRNNFVKMDQAHIKASIPVSKEIPVNFILNVNGPTRVTLSESVPINGARVTVNTGGLNINNALANIVLPQGTVLPIYIENLVVPVDQKVLAELNVAVDIPLNETELHEPFVGLRQVVEPFYCMLNDCP